MTKAAVGIAGVNTRPNQKAAVGIAGVDSKRTYQQHQAGLGVAGVDRLIKAQVAIAGNWSTTIRPTLQEVVAKRPIISANRIGDQAAMRSWRHAVYLSDYTYLVCTDPENGVRWRNGFEEMFAPEARRLPLYLDSAAFRRATGTAPKWNTYESYCRAIDLTQPSGWMAYDVMGDQAASLQGYQRMVDDGYGDRCIPVWQMGPAWDDGASDRLIGWTSASDEVRAAVANARLAAADPVMRLYAERTHLIAIGGMVKGKCPRTVRHVYLAELARLMPDHQFWGLGQASQPVVNGLGQMGLLDRIWLDGSWWIHNARCEHIAVVQDGLIKSIRLESTGARSFFTMSEMMASNLRSLLGAYAGLWTFPGPPAVPTDMEDMDAVLELRKRLNVEQFDLWKLYPGFEETGTEG